MKKTLFATMLGCSFCAAASAVSLDDAVIGAGAEFPQIVSSANTISLDDAVIGFADFDGGRGTAVGTEAANLTTTTLANGNVELTLGNSRYFNSSLSTGRTCMTFTLILDPAKITTLPSAGADGSITAVSIIKDKTSGWGLGVNSNGMLTGTWAANTAFYTTAASIESSAPLTITMVTGVIAPPSEGSRIYLGNEGNTFWSNTGLKGSDDSSTLVINSDFVDAIQKLYVFNTDLEATEVAIVAKAAEVVPEPTTAALSLLALAGLATRRRRK